MCWKVIERRFGLQSGLIVAKRAELLDRGMAYVPKYVLTENQINGLLAGLMHQVKEARP